MTDLEAAKLEGVRLGLEAAARGMVLASKIWHPYEQAHYVLLMVAEDVLTINPAGIVWEATPDREKEQGEGDESA